MTFGEKLRQLRTAKGLRLIDVSTELNVHIMTYTRYELDKREPSLDMLKTLCKFFDVSADYLIGLTDEY